MANKSILDFAGIAEILDRRASRLNWLSYTLIIIILASLTGGGIVFYFPPTITDPTEYFQRKNEFDLKLNNEVRLFVEKSVSYAENKYEEGNGVCTPWPSYDGFLTSDGPYYVETFDQQRFQSNFLEFIRAKDVAGVLPYLPAAFEQNTQQLAQTLRGFRRDLDYTKAPKMPKDLSSIVAVLITRFGGLSVLIFMTGILINLFRYTMRLSSFHSARADALRLGETELFGFFDVDQYGKIVTILSPDAYDFSKWPASPTELMAQIAKDVAARLSPKTEK